MDEKQMRKLSRYQLLELLIMQTERADALEKKVAELEERLNEKEIRISALGSIAEASLQLSGVFEAAQKAANIYLDNAMRKADEIEAAAKKRAAKKRAEGRL